jgi:hypothetical protein
MDTLGISKQMVKARKHPYREYLLRAISVMRSTVKLLQVLAVALQPRSTQSDGSVKTIWEMKPRSSRQSF